MNMNDMGNFNGVKGNGLSDQPIEVQRLVNTHWDAIQKRGQEKNFNPLSLLDPLGILGGLFGQIFGGGAQKAIAPAQAQAQAALPYDPTKGFDPAVLQLLAGLIGQAINGLTPKAAAMSKGEMRRDYVLQNGAFETFPTWSFWGETTVRLDNVGAVPTTVLVGDQRFHLNPGEGTTTSGKWAAFPIRVTNTSELPGAQVNVRVW